MMKYAPKGFQEDDGAGIASATVARSAVESIRGSNVCPALKGSTVKFGLVRCYSCTHLFDPEAQGAMSDVLCPCCA